MDFLLKARNLYLKADKNNQYMSIFCIMFYLAKIFYYSINYYSCKNTVEK